MLKVIYQRHELSPGQYGYQVLLSFFEGEVIESKEFSRFINGQETLNSVENLETLVETFCDARGIETFSLTEKEDFNDLMKNTNDVSSFWSGLKLRSRIKKPETTDKKFGFFKKFFQ